MATGTNTRSNNVVQFTIAPSQPGDCISDKMARELARRMNATVIETSTPGDAVVSRTPPNDTTKIWYPADENGFPIGAAYKFNTLTGQWISTAVVPLPPPCRSADANNLIKLDSAGCWIVDRTAIETIIQSTGLQISADQDNAIRAGSDGGLYVEIVDTSTVGQIEIFESPVSITSATAAVASSVADLSALPGVTVPAWASHAIVRARTSLFTNNLGSNNTNKAFTRISLNGDQVVGVGPSLGSNNNIDSAGVDTNDVYVELDGQNLTYLFTVNQSPGWDAAQDKVEFSLHLLGFIRASIA